LTPDLPLAVLAVGSRAIVIADVARELNRRRDAWLNPLDLVFIEEEVTPTAAPGEEPIKYPAHIVP